MILTPVAPPPPHYSTIVTYCALRVTPLSRTCAISCSLSPGARVESARSRIDKPRPAQNNSTTQHSSLHHVECLCCTVRSPPTFNVQNGGVLRTMQHIPIPHHHVQTKRDRLNGWKTSAAALTKYVFRWINYLPPPQQQKTHEKTITDRQLRSDHARERQTTTDHNRP